MIPANDLQAIALSRLAHQYRDSPNLKAVIALFIGKIVEIRDAFLTLEAVRRIDDAEGDGLDSIGELIGQPRELFGVLPLDFFALHDGAGGPAEEGFGDLTAPEDGRRFRSVNEAEAANRNVGDNEMRRLLRAKIVRNRTSATPENIITSIRAVLEDTPLVHLTFASQIVTATVQRPLSTDEDALLNATGGIRGEIPIIPRPIGVGLTVVGL